MEWFLTSWAAEGPDFTWKPKVPKPNLLMLVGPFGQSFQLEGLGLMGLYEKTGSSDFFFMGAFFGYFELGRFHHHELLDVFQPTITDLEDPVGNPWFFVACAGWKMHQISISPPSHDTTVG